MATVEATGGWGLGGGRLEGCVNGGGDRESKISSGWLGGSNLVAK